MAKLDSRPGNGTIADDDIFWKDTAGSAQSQKITGAQLKAHFMQLGGNAPMTGNLRRSVETGITADVGSAQGGSPLTKDINIIGTCANAGDSVTLPAAAAGLTITIVNNGAQSADVFPASGDDLGAGVDTAAALAAGDAVTYSAYDATNWVAVA